jgi:hypothetical protein
MREIVLGWRLVPGCEKTERPPDRQMHERGV